MSLGILVQVPILLPCAAQTQEQIRALVAAETAGDRFVTKILRRRLGLSR
jgi:hypothetical protein